jgi:hypothetical protein
LQETCRKPASPCLLLLLLLLLDNCGSAVQLQRPWQTARCCPLQKNLQKAGFTLPTAAAAAAGYLRLCCAVEASPASCLWRLFAKKLAKSRLHPTYCCCC